MHSYFEWGAHVATQRFWRSSIRDESVTIITWYCFGCRWLIPFSCNTCSVHKRRAIIVWPIVDWYRIKCSKQHHYICNLFFTYGWGNWELGQTKAQEGLSSSNLKQGLSNRARQLAHTCWNHRYFFKRNSLTVILFFYRLPLTDRLAGREPLFTLFKLAKPYGPSTFEGNENKIWQSRITTATYWSLYSDLCFHVDRLQRGVAAPVTVLQWNSIWHICFLPYILNTERGTFGYCVR